MSPQAPQYLRDEFEDDRAAFAVLGDNFYVSKGGIISQQQGHVVTAQENRAIDYLFMEWDYGYEAGGAPPQAPAEEPK